MCDKTDLLLVFQATQYWNNTSLKERGREGEREGGREGGREGRERGREGGEGGEERLRQLVQ